MIVILFSGVTANSQKTDDKDSFSPSFPMVRLQDYIEEAEEIDLIVVYPSKLSLLQFTKDPLANKFKAYPLLDGQPILHRKELSKDVLRNLIKEQTSKVAPHREINLSFNPNVVIKIQIRGEKSIRLKSDLNLKVGMIEIGDMHKLIEFNDEFVKALGKIVENHTFPDK